jgi:hypothetical protein
VSYPTRKITHNAVPSDYLGHHPKFTFDVVASGRRCVEVAFWPDEGLGSKSFPLTSSTGGFQAVFVVATIDGLSIVPFKVFTVLVIILISPYTRNSGFRYGVFGLADFKFTRLYAPSIFIP